MTYLTALGLALGLALDTAIVAASRAIAGRPSRWLPWLFGIAHVAMASVGWWIGREAGARVQQWDHWVAFALLALIGGRMIVAPGGTEEAPPAERPWEIAALCVATSIDALAAGVAIDALGIPPAVAIGMIGAVCVAMSLAALAAGRWIGLRAGRHLERLGGALLVAIAIRVVVLHES